LPTAQYFELAASPATEEMVAAKIVCGLDPERHLEILRRYLDAGYDEVYVSQVGDDRAGYFDFYQRELRPRLGL
jgi:hypothetical protein